MKHPAWNPAWHIAALVFALLFCAGFAPSQAAVIIQLRVVDGEGAIYGTGSRATRGISVLVTDETGSPVDGATVSFRLPDQGASGMFPGGLRTELVTTHPDGKAAIWGMQWNKTPGTMEVRVTASKDEARAGIVVTQYLTDAVASRSGLTGQFRPSHSSRTKWLVWGAVAAGAGAGLVLFVSNQSPSKSVSPVTPTQIGIPSILIGPPK